MTNTHSPAGARAHARAQAEAATPTTPDTPPGLDPTTILVAQRIPPGGYANIVLGRGTRIRLADPSGTTCAHLFLLRAESPWERLNVADTVKVPWQAYLSAGHPLLSDQGRVLATVLTDTSGHHDTLCGPTTDGRHQLHLAAAKEGLEPRDVGPSIALFRGARVAPNGAIESTGNGDAGATIDLLVHLPLTLLVANAPHPLDDRPTGDLDLLAWPAPADRAGNDDPEYRRAVENTEAAWTAALNREVPA
ncbi:DUF1989 domain-containing protein [Nocardia fluminea]|uniref:DUF1989 domain-containing protein n=1 Tax=Nocardia fluminea TaxID=134984 RepID=A0A2N3VCS0_9NOCA|nr:DUF1989 domain-containing protein [Nocardia fluminea]PKV79405.1 hypothetical protein ATK86_3798 [Nocardia fluminea]